MRTILSIVAVGLFLMACGPQTPGSVEPAPKAVPEPAQSRAVVGPIQITFSELGAGEINGSTQQSVDRIKGHFPDAEVRRERAGEHDIIAIRRPDGLRVDLHPGSDPKRVGRILGRGGPVKGPLGEDLGAGWVDLGFTPDMCVRGQDTTGQTLVCYRPGEPRLGYVFDLPSFEGPGDGSPSVEFLAENATLRAFLWTAA